MSISVTVNIAQTNQALRSMIERLSDRTTINRKVSIELYGWVMRNFNSAGSLQDPVWAPLAPSTAKEKARKGYSSQPLLRTGHLRQSFAPFADRDKAGVGARASFGVDYAAVHEEGTDKIPARPMLPPVRVAQEIAVNIYGLEIERLRAETGL